MHSSSGPAPLDTVCRHEGLLEGNLLIVVARFCILGTRSFLSTFTMSRTDFVPSRTVPPPGPRASFRQNYACTL